jgi:hypothetical protein
VSTMGHHESCGRCHQNVCGCAQQPREPSPELDEADRWLRETVERIRTKTIDGGPGCPTSADAWKHAPTIAAELDRLRAQVAAQAAEIERLKLAPCELRNAELLNESRPCSRGKVSPAPQPADSATMAWKRDSTPGCDCDGFNPLPRELGDSRCQGDGHYMCRECAHFAPDEEPTP